MQLHPRLLAKQFDVDAFESKEFKERESRNGQAAPSNNSSKPKEAKQSGDESQSWGFRSWEVTQQGRDIVRLETVLLIRSLINASPAAALYALQAKLATATPSELATLATTAAVPASWADGFLPLLHARVAQSLHVVYALHARSRERKETNKARAAKEAEWRAKEREAKAAKDKAASGSTAAPTPATPKSAETPKTDDSKTAESKDSKQADAKASEPTAAPLARSVSQFVPPVDVSHLTSNEALLNAVAALVPSLELLGAFVPPLCRGTLVDVALYPSSPIVVTESSGAAASPTAESKASDPVEIKRGVSGDRKELKAEFKAAVAAAELTAAASGTPSLVRARIYSFDPLTYSTKVRLPAGLREGERTAALHPSFATDQVRFLLVRRNSNSFFTAVPGG